MKKLTLTIAIILGLGLSTFAEQGGLFNRGANTESSGLDSRSGARPMFPIHNQNSNQNANPTSPVGSGTVILLGLGAAYLVGKKRREE